jgi:hypothetical protein
LPDLLAEPHDRLCKQNTRQNNYTMVPGTPLRVNDVGTALVVVQVPLKPGSEPIEAPGAMVPLYERLVIVTVLPDWVKVPFQPEVTV